MNKIKILQGQLGYRLTKALQQIAKLCSQFWS